VKLAENKKTKKISTEFLPIANRILTIRLQKDFNYPLANRILTIR